MSLGHFQKLLEPLRQYIEKLDPKDPIKCQEKLHQHFPVDSPNIRAIAESFARGCEEGWCCQKKAGTIRFSRIYKPVDITECSIDAVSMSGKGPGHTHPNGEFDLCMPLSGNPIFDRVTSRWVVYPPGSWHEPTVENGAMNILYFLPDGAIEFGPKP